MMRNVYVLCVYGVYLILLLAYCKKLRFRTIVAPGGKFHAIAVFSRYT